MNEVENTTWVVMASFDGPDEERPEFENTLRIELARWEDEARRAGLDPADHVRLDRDGRTASIAVSPELDRAFTPTQTLWRAE